MAAKVKKPAKVKITRADLPAFQQEHNLAATGNYDASTRAAIKAARAGRKVKPASVSVRRVAERQQALDDPNALVQPLTPRQVSTNAATAARVRFAPQERAVQQQQAASDMQQQRLGSWYDDYLARVEAGKAATAQGYQQAAQRIEQNVATDQASSGSEDAQRALASRQQQGRQFGSLVAGQGASQNAYLGERTRAGGLQQLQARQGESGRRRVLGQQLADLAGQRGDFVQQYKEAQRGQAVKDYQTAAALQVDSAYKNAGLRVQQQNANTNRLAAKSLSGNRDEQLALDKDKFSSAKQKDDYQRKFGLGPYKPASKPKKPKTTQSVFNGRKQVESARRAYRETIRAGKKYGDYATSAPANMPLAVIHAGYELEKQGYVGPNTVNALKAVGITVPSGWRTKPAVRVKPPKAPTGSTLGATSGSSPSW